MTFDVHSHTLPYQWLNLTKYLASIHLLLRCNFIFHIYSVRSKRGMTNLSPSILLISAEISVNNRKPLLQNKWSFTCSPMYFVTFSFAMRKLRYSVKNRHTCTQRHHEDTFKENMKFNRSILSTIINICLIMAFSLSLMVLFSLAVTPFLMRFLLFFSLNFIPNLRNKKKNNNERHKNVQTNIQQKYSDKHISCGKM